MDQNQIGIQVRSLTTEKTAELNLSILTPEEVALKLKLSKKTIYRLTSRGEIPHRKIGGQYRYVLTDIDQWLKGDLDE